MTTLATRLLVFAQVFVLWTPLSTVAGPYDAPAGYYSTATGTGSTLKSQLHNIIDGHTVFSYGDARSILQVTDQDPNDSDRMLLVYDRVSLDVSSINGGSIPGWDSGNSWNREHTWPRSRNVGSSGPDNSDLHQLRPSDPGVNSDRGNLNFGGAFGQSFGDVSGGFWYPGDADAGMIARQMFYMAVRYDGSDGSTEDLELQAGNPGSQLGDLNALVDWHYRVAPDDFERRRNDVIYDDYQGNRIPFVDHPEWVWSVFVDQANDTTVSVAGSSSIDLGRVYVGGATPSDQSVTINKAGADGTYYLASTTGAATTDFGEYSRPLAMGAGVSDSFDIGLSVSTATSGVTSGTVVVDNLDITTGGGAGNGANDADDVIDLSFTVLDHPIASLAGDSILSATTIDFGSVALGGGLVEQALELFNYDGAGAPAFASDLDLDSLVPVGDSGVLSLDLMASSGLSQGASLAFDAVFDTSSAGAFETTYTLNLSGEDLPGEQQQMVEITLIGEVVAAALAGDYNDDGVVDSADYTVYQDSFGSTVDLAADGDGSGEIDAGDFTVWSNNYGATSAASAAAVPEPSALLLAVGFLLAGRLRQGR